jgi:hypothetical protein
MYTFLYLALTVLGLYSTLRFGLACERSVCCDQHDFPVCVLGVFCLAALLGVNHYEAVGFDLALLNSLGAYTLSMGALWRVYRNDPQASE